jgi:Lipocalin-like domain
MEIVRGTTGGNLNKNYSIPSARVGLTIVSVSFLLLLLISSNPVLQAQSPSPIVGTWKLISYENHLADGSISFPYGKKPQGYFVYDSTGHVSVQIMRTPPMKDIPGLRDGKGEGDQYREAFLSYTAYFGTYTVDRTKGTVTHHVEGSFRPDYTGTDQVRPFRIDGDHLIIEIRKDQEYDRRELTRVK